MAPLLSSNNLYPALLVSVLTTTGREAGSAGGKEASPRTDVIFLKKTPFPDFPGGAVVKNPPANAGDTGSSPGPLSGKIPHAPEHAPHAPCAKTTEPVL